MPVNLLIPSLGDKFQDYRQGIPGDSYSWGPAINANEIRFFTFHHSVTPQTAKNDGNWKAECDKIANLHLSRGWDGVGYRFIICSDGTVAYVGDLARGGSAVGGYNHVMFSACFVGDNSKGLPTASQVHSAHLLAKHFLTQMPAYPNLSTWDQIKGHKNFNATMCPSPAWEGVADSLRDRVVNDRFDGYPNPQPISVSPQPNPEPEPEPQPPHTCPEPDPLLIANADKWVEVTKLGLSTVKQVQDALEQARITQSVQGKLTRIRDIANEK